ncbi:MAG TPA: pyridoxamine 5'-phosphate oxidase family protein [Chloroflexota bacterium]
MRLRELLDSESHAVLATIAARRDGWPFASVTAYASTPSGEPLLLLSDLAEHTRNLDADPRASLLIHDAEAARDPAAGSRVTLVGTAERLDGAANDEAQNRYVGRHPEASAYLALADFHFWVLRVAEARFVNGFGAAGWLSGERLSAALEP